MPAKLLFRLFVLLTACFSPALSFAQIPTKVFEITDLLVDGCDGGNEGKNEMVLFQIGPNPINVANLRVDGAGSTGAIQTAKWPNTANIWRGIATPPAMPAAVASINSTITGCGVLIEPVGGILPAGKKILLITSTAFNPAAHSFATLGDTLYVIFQMAGNTAGHFVNYDIASSTRTMVLVHVPTGGADTVIYDRSFLTLTNGTPGLQDGASVKYTWSGSASYYNNGCQAPYTVLDPAWTPDTVCQNASPVNLNNLLTGTPGGTWSGTGVTGNMFNPAGLSGNIPVSYTIGPAPCDTTFTQNILVQIAPDASWTAPTTVCQSASPINLSTLITGTTGGTWSGSGVSGNSFNPSGLNGNISVTYTVGVSPCSASSTQIINVMANLVVTPTAAPATVCPGSPSSLSATSSAPSTTYAWTPGSLTGSPVTVTPGATQTYTVTGTAAGCTGSASITVTVSNAPNATISYGGPYCLYDTDPAPVFGAGASAGVFSSSAGLIFINTSTGLVDLSASAPGTYTITNFIAASGGCMSATDTARITINPTPSVTPPANIIVCNGASVPSTTITGTPTGVAFSWVNSNTAIGLAASGTGNIPAFTASNTTSAPIAGTITITPAANGCTGTAQTFIITVNPPPAINFPVIPGICESATAITLPVATPAGGTYSGNGVTGNTFDPAVTGTGTFVITYTYTDAIGCVNSVDRNLTVYPLPTVSVVPQNAAICPGSHIELTASGAVTYEWSSSSDLNTTTGAIVTATPAATATYMVTGTANGCTGSASTTVFINPLSSLNFTASPRQGCEPLTVNFTIFPGPDIIANSWTLNSGGNCGTSTDTSVTCTYEYSGTYIATLTALSSDGCNISTTTTINVWPGPDASFETFPDITTPDEPRVYFYNNSTNEDFWSWDFGDPDSYTLNYSTAESPFHDFNNPGTYNVLLSISNQYGCSDTATHTVLVLDPLAFWIPNAFSPNGNLVNDFFGPSGIGIIEESFVMRIFDRWGKELYFTKDLNAPWNGKDLSSGKTFPDGVYSYQIYITDERGYHHEYLGTVTLLNGLQ